MTTLKIDSQKKLGFIGLGMMGSRMIKHLKGYEELRIFDANPDAVQRGANETGAIAAASLQDMASADIVIFMLPNSSIIDKIVRGCDGEPGLIDILAPGSLIIDMSSASPSNTIVNANAAANKSIGYIDAPVSGGPGGAESAKLTIMVGCEPVQFDQVKPLLTLVGLNVVRAGDVGAGHAVKALNNLLAATILSVTGEVFAAGEKFGLDPIVMQGIVNTSTGGSYMTNIAWPKAILGHTWDFGFSLQLMHKDVGIGLSLLKETGVDAPLSTLNGKVWSEALAKVPGTVDMTEVVRQTQEKAGLSTGLSQ